MDQPIIRVRRRRHLGSGSLQVRLEVTLRVLESLGVRVPASGRHRQALRLLSDLNSADGIVDLGSIADLHSLASAHRTAWETFLITVAATECLGRSYTPFSVAKLEECMLGGISTESQNSPGEDTQFELYVAACLVLGGLDVREGEPDLQFLYGYEWVGIAAKRVRSSASSQLRKHIKKAIEQIRRSNMRGFVAVNLDQRFNDIDAASVEADLSQVLADRFDSVIRAGPPLGSSPMALGYLAFGYFTYWHQPDPSTSPKLQFFTPRRWHAWARDPGEELLFRDLHAGWSQRLDTRMDLLSDAAWNGRL
jgi:hypothetical protein